MKDARRWILPVLMTVMAALGCAQSAPTDTRADVAAINEVREREIALVATSDANRLLTVFTSDAVMMPPNEPAVHGQDAMRKWAEATFAQVSMSGRYTTSDVTVSGDWAVDRFAGVLTMTPKGGGSAIEETIKGVHIMKRQPDGTWRIALDVWNPDAPPPPSPPPPPVTK